MNVNCVVTIAKCFIGMSTALIEVVDRNMNEQFKCAKELKKNCHLKVARFVNKDCCKVKFKRHDTI